MPEIETTTRPESPTKRTWLQRFRHGTIGFTLTEEMSGEHQFEPGFGEPGRQPMVFRITWGPTSVRDWLNPRGDRFLTQAAEGTVSITGLCEDAPCRGSLALRYFDEGRICYNLDFEAGGKSYQLFAEKVNIRPWNLPVSHTTCYGTLLESDSGRLVSRSVTHFRFRTLLSFLLSFRCTMKDPEHPVSTSQPT